ncbi:MAG: Signal peptidase-like protein [Gemmatimonadetes bacterium]|nr:Signal peptidase-like protein [Gemmatimonadota bacterium]
MPQLVEVRFKGNRKAYFEWHESEPLRAAEPVIVESERGLDLGLVSATGKTAELKCTRCTGCALSAERGERGESGESPAPRRPPEPTRRVVRRASPADHRAALDLRRSEDDVRRKVRERATARGLTMKVSDAEWQWDRNKLTVYFTAEKRVDFRALVRDLASHFRTRIELRQIGVRDEAARLSGIGRCGRELCSASWLPELRPIGLQIAKDQRLSLNPSQISGPCGRLLCCLRYEHEFYVQARKRFPKEGKVLATARGAAKVQSIDIFRETVTLRAEDGATRVVALTELKKEVDAGAAPVAPPPEGTGAEGLPGEVEAGEARPGGRAAASSDGAQPGPPTGPTEPATLRADRRRRQGRRRHRP